MTNAKRELKGLLLMELRVCQLCEELDKIETSVNRVNRWSTDTPVQGGKSGREELLIKLADMRYDVNKSINNLVDEKQRVRARIDRIDDPLLAEILHERYLGCRTWPEIAINVNCSERNVYRLHGKALQAYENIGSICQ